MLFTFIYVHLLLGPEKHWTYRWIHAVDGTSALPFVLEVFSSSQPEVFSRICPSKSTVSAQIRPLCRTHFHEVRCLRRPLCLSDLPGVHSDESSPCGRLVALPHQQLRDGDVHHR